MNRAWHARRAKREIRWLTTRPTACLCHDARHLAVLPISRTFSMFRAQGLELRLDVKLREHEASPEQPLSTRDGE